ncbi:MAG: hypothetical protein HQK49_18270 [Oligoflexia bacterium]|nr:hypothetical protein [Oligoflexia bacterium]
MAVSLKKLKKIIVIVCAINISINFSILPSSHSSCYKLIDEIESPKEVESNVSTTGGGVTDYLWGFVYSFLPVPSVVNESGKGVYNVYKAIKKVNEQTNINYSRRTSYLLQDAQMYLRSKENNHKNIVLGSSLKMFYAETAAATGLSLQQTANLLLESNHYEFICSHSKHSYKNFDILIEQIKNGDFQKSLNKLKVFTNDNDKMNLYPLPQKLTLNQENFTSNCNGTEKESLLGLGFNVLGSLISNTTSIAWKLSTLPIRIPFKTAKVMYNGTTGAISGVTKVAKLVGNVYKTYSTGNGPTQKSNLISEDQDRKLNSKEIEETLNNIVSKSEVVDDNLYRDSAINELMVEANLYDIKREKYKDCDSNYFLCLLSSKTRD